MILNKDKKINTIYHLGDIHIRRNNERDNEYLEIFAQLNNEIKKDVKNALIICTGDIFNDGLSPSAIILAKQLFLGLCELCDVIVFRGNHDQTTKSNPEAIDYLSPILYKLETTYKIYILNQSGAYKYGNIVFGYTDIYDNQVYHIKTRDEMKIGLWHGTIYGSKNYDGLDLSNQSKFTVDDFSGYDYVLLGDIHKHQYLNKKKTIAYCGSLIQQNYGEHMQDHGFIKWDLKHKTSVHVHLPNKYGFTTVEIKDNVTKEYIEFPQNVNLRIIHCGTDEELVKLIHDKIAKNVNIISYKEENNQTGFTYDEIKDGHTQEINNDQIVIDRLIKYIDENYVPTPEDNKQINHILTKIVNKINYNYESNKKNIKLKSLMFNNFNVYGVGNCVDYSSMKGIINICGKNGIGKSSVAVLVLLYAIYGACEEPTIGKYEYVNNKRKNMMTSIILDVNGIEYRILRHASFSDKKKRSDHFKNSVILYKNGIDISEKDMLSTNKKIRDIVGDIDELINLCIMEQKKNISFLNLSDIDKKNYLCNLLKLDIYNMIHDEMVQKTKAYTSKINDINKKIYNDPKNKTNEISTQLDIDIKKLDNELQIIKQKEKEYEHLFNSVNKEKIEKELKLSELKDINFGLIKNTDIFAQMEQCKNDILKLKHSCDQLNQKIKDNHKQLEKYKNIESKKKEFEEQKTIQLEKLNGEIHDLYKQYIKVEHQNWDIHKITNDIQHYEHARDHAVKQLSRTNHIIDVLYTKIYDHTLNKHAKLGYQKYLNHKEKIDRLNEKEKMINSKMNDICHNLEQHNNQYNCIQKNKTQIESEIGKLNDQLKKYIDMDHQNEIFEKNKADKIYQLTKELEENMRKYEKLDPITNINQKEYHQLKQELSRLNIDHNYIIDEILELKNKIVKIDEPEWETHYKQFVIINETCEKIKEKINVLSKRHDELQSHYKMLKNHKYNEKCKICMSNDITKDKLLTEKNIEMTKAKIDEYQNELDINLKKWDTNKKYNKYNQMSVQNQEYQRMIDEKEKMIKIVSAQFETTKMKITIINEQKDKYDTYLRKQEKNKQIDIDIQKYKNEIKTTQETKNEQYEQFQKLTKIKKEHENKIISLNGEMIQYETMILNKNAIQLELDKLNERKNALVLKYQQYEPYGISHDENEANLLLFNTKKSELLSLHESVKHYELNLDVSRKKIQEYHIYMKNIKNNEHINKLISKKKVHLEQIKDTIYHEYEEYRKIIHSNDEIQKQLSSAQFSIKNLELKEISIQKKIDQNKELQQKKKQWDQLNRDIQPINERYDMIIKQLDETKEEKLDLNNKLCELKNELKTINEMTQNSMTIEKKKNMYLKLIDIIKNGFVDNLLTNKVIPNFCINVNNILSSFVDYKIAMKYENKKVIVFKEDTNKLLSNASKLSGYETLMANIAFRLAINDINKLFKTNFFIIDEAFAFCDEQGISKIANLFAYMRKIYDFIIVVSHNEQIKAYTDIDLPIQIKDGFSYVNMMDNRNKHKFEPYIDLFNIKELDYHESQTKMAKKSKIV